MKEDVPHRNPIDCSPHQVDARRSPISRPGASSTSSIRIISGIQSHSALSVSAFFFLFFVEDISHWNHCGFLSGTTVSWVGHCLTNAIQSGLSVAEVDLSVDLGAGV